MDLVTLFIRSSIYYLFNHLSWGDVITGLQEDGDDASNAMGGSEVDLVMPGPHEGRPAAQLPCQRPARGQDRLDHPPHHLAPNLLHADLLSEEEQGEEVASAAVEQLVREGAGRGADLGSQREERCEVDSSAAASFNSSQDCKRAREAG